ncbi:MAG TPA: zinc ribbon domain-containing protein [Peptococcaceae bacterium]|nr:zinc ribbon domain-containing protein [Peptococcaceae bacterium]
MALQPFTDNYEDNSTEAGFQFTFYCDICREGYKTKFIESSTYKKGRFLRGISGAFGAASSMLGGLGRGLERGADILSERFHGMSPDWQREHDQAFELAQNEAKGHFHRCPRCRKWVCENDWNEQDGLCVECAPRQNVEIAAARAKRITEEIEEAASQSKLFTGKIESKQTICPRCGKPSGEGKFCNNCGASLKLNVCPRCGAENSAQSRFCGECGNRLQ